MIFLDSNIIDAITDTDNRIVEIAGLPDSGVTSTAIHILKELDGLAMYIAYKPFLSPQVELFKQYLGKDMDRVIFVAVEGAEGLIEAIRSVGSEVDYVIVDDFAYYILHKDRRYIKKLASVVYAKAVELDTSIWLLNQLRHDVYGKNQDKSMGGYITLYADYLEPRLDLRILVERGKETNNYNIYARLTNFRPKRLKITRKPSDLNIQGFIATTERKDYDYSK